MLGDNVLSLRCVTEVTVVQLRSPDAASVSARCERISPVLQSGPKLAPGLVVDNHLSHPLKCPDAAAALSRIIDSPAVCVMSTNVYVKCHHDHDLCGRFQSQEFVKRCE